MDDVVTLIYTSGTTGPPKAVMLTHRNIAASADGLADLVEVGPDDRVLSYLPLAHIAERMVSEFRSYRYGNATWFLDGLPNLGARLREVRPTHFFGVPRVWEKMAAQVSKQIDASPAPQRALARWAIRHRAPRRRTAAERGEPIPPACERRHRLADRLVLSKLRAALGLRRRPHPRQRRRPHRPRGAALLPVASAWRSARSTARARTPASPRLNRPGRSRIGTVGEVFPGNEVRIAEDGEILVRGGVVFPGYLHNREATEETLVDGWLHTGDVGEFDDDGYLRITDRKKDLIITAGGKNISPGNIEGGARHAPAGRPRRRHRRPPPLHDRPAHARPRGGARRSPRSAAGPTDLEQLRRAPGPARRAAAPRRRGQRQAQPRRAGEAVRRPAAATSPRTRS